MLLVDDNIFSSTATQCMLTQFQLVCDLANDGFEAIEHVKKKLATNGTTYELIFMDFSMPHCNGLDATRGIRKFLSEQAPNAKQPYIVCLTSFTSTQVSARASEAGMDYF